MYVYEFKTGKVYPEHAEQVNLYGMAALLACPAAKEAVCQIIYIDRHQSGDELVLERGMMSSYQWLWDRRIKRATAPQQYPKRPSWRCKGCGYNKDNGGLCEVPPKGERT